MIHIAALRPSEWQALDGKLVDPTFADEFVQALVRFFDDVPADDGANSDAIAVAGYKMKQSNVWNHISTMKLAQALADAPVAGLIAFLPTLPEEFRAAFLMAHMNATRDYNVSVVGIGAAGTIENSLTPGMMGPIYYQGDSSDGLVDISAAFQGVRGLHLVVGNTVSGKKDKPFKLVREDSGRLVRFALENGIVTQSPAESS